MQPWVGKPAYTQTKQRYKDVFTTSIGANDSETSRTVEKGKIMNRLQKLGMPLGGVELNDEVDREDREGLFGCGATESASGKFSW